MQQTLEELKEENAAIEAAAAETPQVEAEEVEVVAVEEATEELEGDSQDGDSGNEADKGADDSDTEDWMQADEQTSAEGESVPLSALTKMRGKLKAKNAEQGSEIESLRAEIEALKSGGTAPQKAPAAVKPMPDRDDYDYDDQGKAKFQAELAGWMGEQVTTQVALANQVTTQQTTQTQAMQTLNKSVDDHYGRAAKLAADAGITDDAYQQADLNVRSAIDSVRSGDGDVIMDQLISRLGDGSEKVMYYLGRNDTAREKLKLTLMQDPSGIATGMYLAEIKATKAIPKQRVSRASKPVTQIAGDESGAVTGDAKRLLKDYKDAHSTGNAQAAYNTKQKAKALKIDVSDW